MKAEITSLRLQPGTQLQEVALAERFGVSRTPVREALQHLQRDGLVERFGRFYRVIRLSAVEIRELCELREALECMAVELAIARAPDMSDALTGIVDRLEAAMRAGDADVANALDSAFHLHICVGAGNSALLRQLELLQDRASLVRGMEQNRPLWAERIVVDHRRIVDAVRRRDAPIAVAEMRYHIRSIIAPRQADLAAQALATCPPDRVHRPARAGRPRQTTG